MYIYIYIQSLSQKKCVQHAIEKCNDTLFDHCYTGDIQKHFILLHFFH